MNYIYLRNIQPICEHALAIKALHQAVNMSKKYYVASTVKWEVLSFLVFILFTSHISFHFT
jgi:hypothetical protein